ncbi:uncharacterized protein [Littorina saxatilis]|uniref:uncharacterized protein n=1 Tax=Littorina saxatilis TaxID=31220 RepID=UPI0038B60F11
MTEIAPLGSFRAKASYRTEVLKCEWITNSLKYECDAQNGFTHDTAIRDRLTLKIPTVIDTFSGMYSCFILPAGGTDPHACELTVKVGKPSTEQEDDSNMIWLVVLLIIPAAAVLMFFLHRRRRSRNRQSHSHMDTRVEVPLTRHMDTRVEVPLIQGVDGQEPVYSQMKDEKGVVGKSGASLDQLLKTTDGRVGDVTACRKTPPDGDGLTGYPSSSNSIQHREDK